MLAGVFVLSSGTSVLNQVQECKRDAVMQRTCRRPIPQGKVSCSHASILAGVLIICGTLFLSANGWIPMVLGLLNVVFYNLVYTPLKIRTWLAIIPGAVVGAVPPLIGWTSAGFYVFHPNALFLSIFVFLWQIPHFWLLMIQYGKEYELAGFRSITGVLNEHQMKLVIFIWGLITSLFLMLFPLFGFRLDPLLIVVGVLVNIFFISQFYRFLFQKMNSNMVRYAFILINSYAFVVFLLLMINAVIA